MGHLRRLAALSAGAAALVLVTFAGTAAAHVAPTVSAVPAGQQATVGFTIEHGCDDLPTDKIEIQAPELVGDVKAVDVAGWTSSVDGQVVTFEGGSQSAHEALEVSISFIAPDTEGETLAFPVVQSCGDQRLDWIETGADAENPAPTVRVGPASATPTTVAEEHEGEHGEEGGNDEGGDHHEESAEPAAAAADEEEPASTAPIIIGVVVAVLVVGTAAIVLVTRKQKD